MLLPFSFFFINKPTLKSRQRLSQLVSSGFLNDCDSCQTLIRSCILYILVHLPDRVLDSG